MNWRLPRVVLLVVLLVSMLGLSQTGLSLSPVGASVVQELCPTPPATPAAMGIDLDIERQLVRLDEPPGSPDIDVWVEQVWLAAGETVSIHAFPNEVVYVADGSVILTVCEGDSVTVTPGPGGTPTPVAGPNTMPLDPDDAVYASSTVRYYLTGDVPESGDAPESRIVLTMFIPGGSAGGALCGSAGC